MTDFTNHTGVALVIGGSGGIGSAICRLLADRGSNVAFTFNKNIDTAQTLQKDIEKQKKLCISTSLHLTDQNEVHQFTDSLREQGGIHSFIYAAGPTVPQMHLSKINPSQFAEHLHNEVNSFFVTVSSALPQLRDQKGSITAVTTAATNRFPIKDGLSASPKAAIEVLIQGLAKEEGRFGIRANAVGPGMLTDGMAENLIKSGEYSQNDLDIAIANIPLKRYGNAADIAEAVCFLASPNASYISGQILNVDGGYTA
ncbi:MAG: SDR family oxidoreductase [Actinomycetota bacterium]